jgi:hypothetical protein
MFSQRFFRRFLCEKTVAAFSISVFMTIPIFCRYCFSFVLRFFPPFFSSFFSPLFREKTVATFFISEKFLLQSFAAIVLAGFSIFALSRIFVAALSRIFLAVFRRGFAAFFCGVFWAKFLLHPLSVHWCCNLLQKSNSFTKVFAGGFSRLCFLPRRVYGLATACSRCGRVAEWLTLATNLFAAQVQILVRSFLFAGFYS